MKNLFETITAPVTPLSVGGVGVIRISGEKSFEIAGKIFNKTFTVGQINHGWVTSDGVKIDEVILLPFKAPKSFTGEDVVEIQTHGSPVIIKEILKLILNNGAKYAERGEFSKRAFLNHKIDLSQAEAILDLIHSKTSAFAINSAKNLEGALRREIEQIKLDITKILAKILASLDFPDDVAEVEYNLIQKKLENSIEKIKKILENAHCHNVLREGIKIAIVGCPNVGKSSLFNALLSLERAIVTDIAGTTRDSITESVDIKGISATLIDTAGIRESENIDKVEKIGIENSIEIINNADLILRLYDGTIGITPYDNEVFSLVPNEKPLITIATKQDMANFIKIQNTKNHLGVSSTTCVGISELKEAIYETVLGSNTTETAFSTNQRQQECLSKALFALETALEATINEEIQDLISIDIKQALINLDEITGEVITEDILTHIFENFCIGK